MDGPPGLSGELPDDAVAIQALLRSAGVTDYEPRVVQQLLDFTYRYVADVLQDAEAFGAQVGGAPGAVGYDDLMLAIQSRQVHSFVQPPSAVLLQEVADGVNAQPLPASLRPKPGLRLPPEEDRLTAPTFAYKPPGSEHRAAAAQHKRG
jgi:hypothetical protein